MGASHLPMAANLIDTSVAEEVLCSPSDSHRILKAHFPDQEVFVRDFLQILHLVLRIIREILEIIEHLSDWF